MSRSLEILCCVLMCMVILASCSKSEPEKEIIEEPATLEGSYTGTWNSVTQITSFKDSPISAKLMFLGTNQNALIGDFFATASFTSCCMSGANDGSLSVRIAGDSITDFGYSDIIPDCMGQFSGKGVIRSFDQALVIDFTGTDCDGDHIGQLIFKKSK